MATLNKTYDLKITMQEVESILRQHFGIGENNQFNLEIVESEPKPQPNDKSENDWIHVPENWKVGRCPTEFLVPTMIEVVYRCGDTETGFHGCWDASWKQENHPMDILKYIVIE